MSFNTLVRAYMDRAQTAEPGSAKATSWLRKLIGSAAAVTLGLGLFSGCSSDPGSESTADDEGGKDDKAGSSKKCYADHDCSAGKYCKKSSSGPVVTPKYGISPSPTPVVKYGIYLPTTGKCKPLAECMTDDNCAEGQRCEGATAGSSCPEGAFCILPPTPPQKGICAIECMDDADCPTGEACEGATAGSSCPEGAFCILPPTPAKKGLCEVMVAPKYGINPGK